MLVTRTSLLGLVGTALAVAGVVAFGSAGQVALQTQPEPVSFRNGTVALAGTLHLPKGPGPHPAVVVFHSANGPTRDFPTYRHLASSLPAEGYAVLLFDRRGSGASSGDFGTASFQDLARDGIAGIEYLKKRKEIDPTRIGIWGVSQGGWIGPLAATLSPDVAFVVAVSSAGVTPAAQMDYAAVYALRAEGYPAAIEPALQVRATVNQYYRGHVSRERAERAVQDIREAAWFEHAFLPGGGNLPATPAHTKWYLEMDYDPVPVLARVRVPMAFFFGSSDRWVPVEQSIARIKQATYQHPNVMIRRVPGADHLMGTGTPDSGGPVSENYVRDMIRWLDQRVNGEK